MKNLTAGLVLGAITVNLLFWIIPLVAIVVVQAVIRSDAVHRRCFTFVEWIYRRAVAIDSLLLKRVLGIEFIIHGDVPTDPTEQCIVVSNHRSWFDILVIQELITGQGPMLKFLIKRELVYVPVVGWICLALDFPRLTRGKGDDGRQRDFASVAAAAAAINETPCALMNFAEGTRFTFAKRDASHSPYQHLLNPKTGGFRIMLDSLQASIIDITLVYPIDEISFWRCLSGELKQIEVFIDRHPPITSNDARMWLDARWKEKDERFEHSALRPGSA